MAKQELPVDFKDDVLQAEMAGKRKYRIIQNEDGTISLEDVTNYSQIGSNFGAAQMNATNLAVNESFDKNKVIDSLVDIVANEATGYAAGALAVRELNGNLLELQSYHDKKTLASTDLGIMGGVWKAVANNSCIIGKTVHLNMEIYTTATIVANNVYDNVFTIPSQYRPLNDTVVNVIASDVSYKNPVACTSMVMTNGNLFICIPKSTNNYLFIDAEWEIKYTKQQL